MPSVRITRLAAGAVILLVACTDPTAPAPNYAIVISPASAGVVRGTDLQLTVAAFDLAGVPVPTSALAWRSLDTTIGAIETSGVLHARATGTVWITVRTSLGDATAPVRVVTPAARVVLSPLQSNIVVGDSLQVVGLAIDSSDHSITSPAIAWSSLDTAIASIDSRGLVHGRIPGQATIYATQGSAAAAATIRVSTALISLRVLPDDLTFVTGGPVQMRAIYYDGTIFATDPRPTFWSISDTSVATLSPQLMVSGRKPGSVNVIATADGVSDTVRLRFVEARYRDIATGSADKTCAADTTGHLVCWGQAGYWPPSSFGPAPTPMQLQDSVRLASVSVGSGHACGLTPSGAAYCWGGGALGELGTGVSTSSATPVPVSGGLTLRTVRAGFRTTCGLSTDSLVYCWGWDANGEFGDSSQYVYAYAPLVGAMGMKFASLGVGEYRSCGVTAAGDVYCWGGGVLVPYLISGGLTFRSVSVGTSEACGVTTGNKLYCWGGNNPVAIAPLLDFALVSRGGQHACALTAAGAAWCWGTGTSGELGNGANNSAVAPVLVAGGLTFARIATGQGYTCGLSTAGVAYCWGANALGQLGNGTLANANTPQRVVGQP